MPPARDPQRSGESGAWLGGKYLEGGMDCEEMTRIDGEVKSRERNDALGGKGGGWRGWTGWKRRDTGQEALGAGAGAM